jgi:SNF2 family DNA or RNA helicase
VLLLHGAKRKGFRYADFVAADIVLTTAETLSSILQEEADLVSDGFFRHASTRSGAFDKIEREMWVSREKSRVAMAKSKKPDAAIKARPFTAPVPPPAMLCRVAFRRIVMDEFHKISTLPAKIVALATPFRWYLSGTPLASAQALIDALPTIGVLGGVRSPTMKRSVATQLFERRHPQAWAMNYRGALDPGSEVLESYLTGRPPPKGQGGGRPTFWVYGDFFDPWLDPLGDVPALWVLGKTLERIMVRHAVKAGHADPLNLPPKSEVVVHVDFTPVEMQQYRDRLAEVDATVRGLEARERLQARILTVVQLITVLRRAAVDPCYSAASVLRSATAAGTGAGVEAENRRLAIEYVAVEVFRAAVLRAAGTAGFSAELAAKAPAYVRHVKQSEALTRALDGMCADPITMPECSVCLDSMMQPVVLGCGHVFCRECLLGVAQNPTSGDKCPECRGETVKKVKSQMTFPVVEAQGGSPVQEDPLAPPPEGPKVRAAMELLERLLRADRSNKVVITTSFPTAIRDLMTALRRRNIATSVIDGSSTLQQRARMLGDFQNGGEGGTRVCLLSIRVGAAGLTLTAANHMIILEPGTHSGHDAQLVGRCHRMGQIRPVTIHRLVARGTVEEPLTRMLTDGALSLSVGGVKESEKEERVRAVALQLDLLLQRPGASERYEKIYGEAARAVQVARQADEDEDIPYDMNGPPLPASRRSSYMYYPTGAPGDDDDMNFGSSSDDFNDFMDE